MNDQTTILSEQLGISELSTVVFPKWQVLPAMNRSALYRTIVERSTACFSNDWKAITRLADVSPAEETANARHRCHLARLRVFFELRNCGETFTVKVPMRQVASQASQPASLTEAEASFRSSFHPHISDSWNKSFISQSKRNLVRSQRALSG